jgi:hypothetical protein
MRLDIVQATRRRTERARALRIPALVGALLSAALAGAGLAHGQPAERLQTEAAGRPHATADANFCLALRGNGYKVPVTLAAMARLTEEFGVADVVLGSSSGSIAAFLHENILLNPAIRNCGGQPCAEAVLARRVSLAIKSMLGFSDYLRGTRGGRVVDRIAGRFGAGQPPGLLDIIDVLGDPQLLGMINGRALAPSLAVLNPLNWPEHAARIRRAAGSANFGGGVDFELFLREGLLDLEHALTLVGRVADFYSNSGPDQYEAWQGFYRDCADDQIATGWPSIARRATTGGTSCGEVFLNLVTTFNHLSYPPERQVDHHGGRRNVRRVRRIEPVSLDRTVGQTYPTLATVSFIKGEEIFETFTAEKERFDRFAPVGLEPRDWADHFRIAYFGPRPLLTRIARNDGGFDDLKTRRFYAVGPETWGAAMLRSIGEPGLQAARAYRSPAGDRGVTAGGWVDNFGTQPLRNLGCAHVAFVTRRGSDANFATAVARQLGGDDAFIDGLFSQSTGGSAGEALRAADAVVCTDWDSFEGPLNSPREMASHGYESPLVTRSRWFIEHASEHLSIQTDYATEGCRPPVD